MVASPVLHWSTHTVVQQSITSSGPTATECTSGSSRTPPSLLGASGSSTIQLQQVLYIRNVCKIA